MISLVFIYFIGKAFYDLAEGHSKSKWLFGILGVVSYYAGSFISQVLVYIFYIYQGSTDGKLESDVSSSAWRFIGIPVGLFFCWMFYRILKSIWSRDSESTTSDEVLDSSLLTNNNDQ